MRSSVIHSNEVSKNIDSTKEFLRRFTILKEAKYDDSESNGATNIEESILDLLRFYETHKADINGKRICMIILDELPDICFHASLENSTIVCKVLTTINNLPAIAMPHLILFLLFHSCTYRTKPPKVIKLSNDAKKPIFSSLSYYLHHAYRQKLTLDDKQLMEIIPTTLTPLYSKFLFFADSRCVLTLIQYGLRFQSEDYLPLPVHPIFMSAAEHLSWYIKKPISHQEIDPVEEVRQKCYFRGFLRFHHNFQLLLLSTYNPQKVVFEFPFIITSYFEDLNSEEAKLRLKYMFPELDFQLNEPPNLQHICRWTIREALFNNWNLPYGVWKLPLPSYLKKYINFTCNEKEAKDFKT